MLVRQLLSTHHPVITWTLSADALKAWLDHYFGHLDHQGPYDILSMVSTRFHTQTVGGHTEFAWDLPSIALPNPQQDIDLSEVLPQTYDVLDIHNLTLSEDPTIFCFHRDEFLCQKDVWLAFRKRRRHIPIVRIPDDPNRMAEITAEIIRDFEGVTIV